MMTIQCCKCKRLQTEHGWLEAPQALTGPISHTYCPDCFTETRIEHFSEIASRSAHESAGAVAMLLALSTP